jgi:hypothetical protein
MEAESLPQPGNPDAASNPLDLHAQMFYLYTPRLRNTLNLMSKKALIRLVFMLIQHPLNERELKMREKIEIDAFQIADQMLTSKYFMILGTYMEQATKMQGDKEKTGQTTENSVQLDTEVKDD